MRKHLNHCRFLYQICYHGLKCITWDSYSSLHSAGTEVPACFLFLFLLMVILGTAGDSSSIWILDTSIKEIHTESFVLTSYWPSLGIVNIWVMNQWTEGSVCLFLCLSNKNFRKCIHVYVSMYTCVKTCWWLVSFIMFRFPTNLIRLPLSYILSV